MRLIISAIAVTLFGAFIIIVYLLLSNARQPAVEKIDSGLSSTLSVDKSNLASKENTQLKSAVEKPPQLLINKTSNSSSNNWMILALVMMTTATLVSIIISFYLYRWRKILLSKPHSVIPEKQGEWFKNADSRLVKLNDEISYSVEHVVKQSQVTNEKVSNLVETFMTLQKALNERDNEIRRLKKGYDTEIFRKFISRFITVDKAVEDLQKFKNLDINALHQIKSLLEDAFLECGVESFEPELGSDYRKVEGVADNPKSVQAENPEDAFKIIEILERGYQFRTSEGSEIIVPAKVKIFST